MAVKSGIVGAFYRQSDTTSTFIDEGATLQTDDKTLTIDNTSCVGFVRDKSLFTVKKDGSTISSSLYEIYYDRVIFYDEQIDGEWTITGTIAEAVQVGGVYEWSLDIKEKLNTYDTFESAWQQVAKGVKGYSVSAKSYFTTEEFFDLMSNDLFVRLFTDIDTYDSWIGYVLENSIKISDKHDGLVDEEISFDGNGKLIWCTYAP